jgi:hypothetical protein
MTPVYGTSSGWANPRNIVIVVVTIYIVVPLSYVGSSTGRQRCYLENLFTVLREPPSSLEKIHIHLRNRCRVEFFFPRALVLVQWDAMHVTHLFFARVCRVRTRTRRLARNPRKLAKV